MDNQLVDKKTLVVIFLLSVFITLVFYIKENVDSKTVLSFCKVSKNAHIIYLRVQNKFNLLIGHSFPKDATLLCLGRFVPFYDKEIDTVILLSESDKTLLELHTLKKRYRIKNIYTSIDSPIGLNREYNTFPTNKKLSILDTVYVEQKQSDEVKYLSINTRQNELLIFKELSQNVIKKIVNSGEESTFVYFFHDSVSDKDLLTELLRSRFKQIIGYIRLPYSQVSNSNVINLNNRALFTINLSTQ